MKKLKEIENKNQEYEKYRWFYTSNKHLVIGGKSAEQNEEVINKYKNKDKYVVMHTKSPGSPFSVILAENPSPKDLEEAAIFTACFSRAWREGKKREVVDIFLMEQIIKNKNMQTGTFGVVGPVDRKTIELRLYSEIQKNKLRFIALNPKNKESICITPGKINKEQFAEQIAIKLETPKEQVLSALPSGSFKIIK
ncbi:DUF814 domain-containing protein [Candidatus Pacearchaeota archaeon]|nr:DUF814 domain-containing protein [Candidatus Pacearchaeota archaeon]